MTIATVEQGLILPKRFADVQHREAQIEDVDPDEGTILVRAAPYEIETQLANELFETFERGAFANATKAPSRVKAFYQHRGPLVGHALEVDDRADGVWIKAKLAKTASGEEVRELAREGFLTDVSIEFRPMKEYMKATRKTDGIHVRHSRGHLLGFAFVAVGAYGEHAYVASVRDQDEDRMREEAIARLKSLSH